MVVVGHYAKAKQYALEMVKGIRPGYVPADPIKHLQLETLRATGEGPLAGLASLNIMGGDRHQWEHPRAIDRETLAEVLRSECPVDTKPDLPEPSGDDYTLEYHDDGSPRIPGCLRRG
jgi:hypothetical protein